MQIKIVGCSRNTYWYSTHIGEVFNVTGEGSTDYSVEPEGYSTYSMVLKKDAEIVNENNDRCYEDACMSQCEDTPDGVTPNYYSKWYKGVKLDPYRIAQLYEVGGGPQEQVLKKALRGCHKGHEELQVIKEIRQALDRWEEMLEEDSTTTSQRDTEEK